jgi:hypothetical protein
MNEVITKPEVWTVNNNREKRSFLVCGNRWLRGQIEKVDKEKDSIQYSFIAHAVAIDITSKSEIHICNINDRNGEWRRERVEDHNLSMHSAKAALDYAWHLFNVDQNLFTKKVDVVYHVKRANYKNNSKLWKIVAMVEWHNWNTLGLSKSERVKMLHKFGFPKVTEDALRRTAEEAGL